MWRSISKFMGGLTGALFGLLGSLIIIAVPYVLAGSHQFGVIGKDIATAVVVVGTVTGGIAGYRWVKKDVGRRPSECQRCGHSILDLQGDRCPECGHPLEDFQRESTAKPNEPSAPDEPRA